MKIGLFFGTYNPIHIGHLAIANYIVEFSDIDQLWFVISPQSPYKQKSSLLNNYDRLELVNLAIQDDSRFKACDIEFRLPTPSYTVNTLTYLAEKYPMHTFSPIMGADNLIHLHKWKNSEILRDRYEFMVYPRPGVNLNQIAFEGKYQVVQAPLIEISSTFIRNAISDNKNVRHYLPQAVWQYINKMGYYIK